MDGQDRLPRPAGITQSGWRQSEVRVHAALKRCYTQRLSGNRTVSRRARPDPSTALRTGSPDLLSVGYKQIFFGKAVVTHSNSKASDGGVPTARVCS